MGIKDVRVKLNSSAIVQLMQSAELGNELAKRGDRIAAAAGPGHEVTTTVNRDRAVTFVTTANKTARQAEAEQRRLSKSIDAGR